MTQKKHNLEVLERAGMLTCNPCRTPVATDSKLAAAGDPVSDPTLYRRLAGALQYLTFTRPDISYAVQQVCLFMHDPREPHFSALKRILWYVCCTLTSGLQLYSSTTSSLVAYSDADWAGCPTTQRFTYGYCVFLGNNLLSWSSKRQFTLSRSSAEAEYRGVANAVAETCWLRNLLRELHTPLSTATIVYCDNMSDVYLSSNHVQNQRTKHIEIDIYFVRDLVTTGHIRVLHVPSRYQYADIFTKGLPTALFDEFRDSLSVRSSPAQTAGGSKKGLFSMDKVTENCEKEDSLMMIGSSTSMLIKLKIPKPNNTAVKEGKRVCSVCKKEFSSSKALGGHMRVHVMYHKNGDVVNKPFKSGSKLFKRIGDKNQDLSDEGLKVMINKPYLSSVNDEGVPTCSQCGKSFPSMKSLFGHMRCHPERFWRGIIPPPNVVLAQGSNSNVVENGVDLTKYLKGRSVTERRGRRSLKMDDSDEDDEDLLEAVEDLMSLANGHRSSVIQGSNSNANSPPSIDKRKAVMQVQMELDDHE
ncbi:ribonuclease H-like domain-containing protein, partial [Tanacetum coccineum]